MENEKENIVLEIEGHPIECDKSLLINNSDYFSAMFTGSFRESVQKNIKIEGVDLKSFNIILLLLWDETYIIDMNDIHLVLQAACMLQFNAIRIICEKRILEMMTPSVSLRIWKTTELLDISPLCLKAKYMALEEFPQIWETDSILELSLDEISAMSWFYVNKGQYQDMGPTKILLKLLSCVNMKKCTRHDINEMMVFYDIRDNQDILEILDIVMRLNSSESLPCHVSENSLLLARQLRKSISRKKPIVPCLLLESNGSKGVRRGTEKAIVILDNFGRTRRLFNIFSTVRETPYYSDMAVLLYDSIVNKFQELFVINEDKIKDLAGFKLLPYKHSVLLFGGEYLIGAGNWNLNLWAFNTFTERWTRVSVVPHPRRHFEAIVLDDCLYIMGGTGRFRVSQDNILWYDFKTDEWSSLASLPTQSRHFKCCTFRGRLYLIYVVEGKVYVFNKEHLSWGKINMAVSKDILDNIGTYAVFTDSKYFYIKGKILLKLKLVDNNLIVESITNTRIKEYDEIDSVQCNNLVFTLYKSTNERCDLVYIFERLNLETFKRNEIFRKTENISEALNIDGRLFYPSVCTKLFTCPYYATENEFVSKLL
ncbi:hypothetical protein GWI33_018015 [Rhynchophorus ferrugineus]|uniref:BTB domain-containing protein n=1 Tax=Rhynchophorus ferrugineus TaxID=354439 RepID=A0A834HVN5_RHYFE|nr:hypothetical protein GWI33_018015 [Rhynchophorus ferrugineus]